MMITNADFPLPPTMPVPELGRLCYGLGRDASYAAAAAGRIPTVRNGRRLVGLTHKALQDLGWSDELIARALGLPSAAPEEERSA